MCARVPVCADSILCGLYISPVEIYFDISLARDLDANHRIEDLNTQTYKTSYRCT